MIVTSDVLAFTAAGLKTEFDAAYRSAQEGAEWTRIASEIPTTLPIQNYGFLGRGAVMKERIDEDIEQEILAKGYTLADKTYTGLLVIERRTLEDDQYGLLQIRAREMGQEPVRHWNQLAYEGIARGFSSLAYDGQYFFDSDHAEGASGTQSNVTNAALSDAALQAAETAMMGFVDDKGVPMGIRPDTLVVGPANARKAHDLVGSPVVVVRPGDGTVSTGATAATNYQNYFQGRYNIVVNPYLRGTSAYYWALLDTSRTIKPIVIQSRSDVPITVETDLTDPQARIKERFQFKVRGRYVQGYGLWQTAYGSNASS
jgi:phage major head subunit gpT-like protein